MAFEVEVDSGQYTPESLRLRRRLAEAMMKQGMDTSPIGSPWQGLARIAQAMMGGYQMGELERKESEQQKSQDEALLALLGPAMGAGPETLAPGPTGQPSISGGDVEAAIAPFASAIAGIETPGESDPYKAKGPVVQSGDRAYGKYQVMGENVPVWTKEILGRQMTPDEFLNDPQAQEKVFAGKFGEYLEKTGSPQDAASMWFTGRPAKDAPNARATGADGEPLGITGSQYVEKFTAGMNAGQGGTAAPQAAQPMTAGQLPPQVTPQVRQRIGALLGNPATRQLGMAMLQRYIVPPAPMTAKDQADLAKTQAETTKIESEVSGKEREVSNEAIEDRYKLQDAVSGLDDTFRATNDLINHPGLPEIAGLPLSGEVGIPAIGTELSIADLRPGTTQADAFNAHKSLISQVALRTMDRLKQQSATGATGFGALSERELKVLENSIGNLRLSSSLDELKKNYKKFQGDLLEMRGRLIERFERKYGDVKPGVMSKQQLIDSATESSLDLAQRPYRTNETLMDLPGDYRLVKPFTATSEPQGAQPQAAPADTLGNMITQIIQGGQPAPVLPQQRTLQDIMSGQPALQKADRLPFRGGF